LGVADQVDIRFQISFKYQILTTEPGLPKLTADNWVAPAGLYFTYTQTSVWDILEESSPFKDTSYKPGIHWQARDLWFREDERGRFRLSLLAGLEHESNGRGEPESRSINVAVLRPTLGYASTGGWRFQLSPKISAYIEKTDNQDIDQYRGYVDLHALVRPPSERPGGGLQLALLARKGTRGQRGSLQADITYPADLLGIPGYFLLQGVVGHGETILEYDKRRDPQLRIGFSAIR
jgi:outer membrane phospholipase A